MFVPVIRVFTAIAFVITSFGAAVFFLFFYFARDLPNYQFLQDFFPAVVSRSYTSEGHLLREYARERRIFTPIQEIPPFLIQAFLSAEDKNFYYHPGINFFSLGRAFLANTFRGKWGGRALGASTITQQVAKNFLVGNERTFGRKIREVIMSVRLEAALSKERILELYLNQIYLGSGAYGVAAAAETYFGKELHQLTVSEACFLASLPKAPTFYHPIKERARAKARRDWVIQRLIEDGVLAQNEGELYQKNPLQVTLKSPGSEGDDYFAEEVRRYLIQTYGENVLYTSGLRIKTTLDRSVQEIAEKSLQQGLEAYDQRHGWRGPLTTINLSITNVDWVSQLKKIDLPPGAAPAVLALVLEVNAACAKIGLKDGSTSHLVIDGVRWAQRYKSDFDKGPAIKSVQDVLTVGDVILVRNETPDQETPTFRLFQVPAVTGGVVVMDAHTGHVLAIGGGYKFDMSHFNCATQALRQPGSAFKTFVYLSALEKGYTRDSVVNDAPLEVSLGAGLGVYAPKNISGKTYGPTPLHTGIERSYNIMTVRLAHQIGMKSVQQMAKRLGVMDAMPLQLAMSLGAGETTVLKLTAAYAMIVNGGNRVDPTFIKRIETRDSRVLYETHPAYVEVDQQLKPVAAHKGERVLNPMIAETMQKMLEGVVQRGTARKIAYLTREFDVTLGGKTGTTNLNKDAWFVGYIKPSKHETRTLVIGTFIGFPTPRSLGLHDGGSKVALPVFESFVKGYLGNKKIWQS